MLGCPSTEVNAGQGWLGTVVKERHCLTRASISAVGSGATWFWNSALGLRPLHDQYRRIAFRIKRFGEVTGPRSPRHENIITNKSPMSATSGLKPER
jgi:hypothetical protein